MRKSAFRLFLFLAATGVVLLFSFELWTLIINWPLAPEKPSNLGNFPENVAAMKRASSDGKIRFAVMGDTRSEGTFETICDQLKDEPLDFGVLLGDITFHGDADEHRWLRREIASMRFMTFPLFYVVGNHDIDNETYPVSQFEKDYGPSNFSFEYEKSLFIFVRAWNKYGSDYEDGLNFLRTLSDRDDLGDFRKRVVFIHQPPPIPTLSPVSDFTRTDEFNRLFQKMKIDYVFAADFHGYAWTRHQGITYNITGGGGAALVQTNPPQFHHALLFEIGEDYTSQQFVVVDSDFDLEDHCERFAFTQLWPILRDSPWSATLVNGILLAVLAAVIIFERRWRRRGDGATTSGNEHLFRWGGPDSMSKYVAALTLYCVILVVLISMGSLDYEWTTILRLHRNDVFRSWIEGTVFKGQAPGLRDIATLALILAGGGYLLSLAKPSFSYLKSLRPCLSLILISGLSCLLFTHSIKLGMSRPRPKYVYAGAVEFTPWYEFGPNMTPGASYKGSMPSGHTSMVAVLISLAYVGLVVSKGWKTRFVTVVLLLSTLSLALMMGVSRAMSAHWFSDMMISVLGCWCVIHLLYRHIVHRSTPNDSVQYVFLDLKLCLRLALFFSGSLFLLWGIHAITGKPGFHVIDLLAAPGVVLILTALNKSRFWTSPVNLSKLNG